MSDLYDDIDFYVSLHEKWDHMCLGYWGHLVWFKTYGGYELSAGSEKAAIHPPNQDVVKNLMYRESEALGMSCLEIDDGL